MTTRTDKVKAFADGVDRLASRVDALAARADATSSESLARIYEIGEDAKIAGKPQDANPYSDAKRREAWLNGYHRQNGYLSSLK